MAGGININIDLDYKKKKKEQLMKWLMDQENYPADSAGFIADRAVRTGNLDLSLPTYRASGMEGNIPERKPNEPFVPAPLPVPKQLPPSRPVPLPPVSGIPERSTIQPFSPMVEDKILPINLSNPPKTSKELMDALIPVPKGTGKIQPIPYDRPAKPEKPEKDPQKETDNYIARLYLKGVSEGFVAPELYDYWKQRAPSFGWEETQVPTPDNKVPPGFFEQFFGGQEKKVPQPPTKVHTYVGKDGNKNTPVSYKSAEEVRAAFRSGKLKRDEANKILKDQFGYQ
jgi:hypothetical protein